MNDMAVQIAAQVTARELARQTGKPVDDGYGARWHPPGEDGIPTAELITLPIPTAQTKPGLSDALFRSIEVGTAAFRYRDVGCVKNPIDLAIYSQLLWEAQPRTIIEVGSGEGGSALWLRDTMRSYGIECLVYSIDLRPPAFAPDGIKFFRGDGRKLPEVMPDVLARMIARPLLVIDDADHQPETTTAILEFFDAWSRPGEYVVVEDGDAEKFYPGSYRGGPLASIKSFLERHGDAYRIDRRLCDMFGITFNPDGYIQRVR